MINRICSIICAVLWIVNILDVGLMGAWYVAGLMAKASFMMAMPVALAVHLYCDERYKKLNKVAHQIAKFNEDKRRLAKEDTDDDTET